MNVPDGRWPDPLQCLAISAAVADHDEAVDAWKRLTAIVDLADLWDAELYRLLPLVWRNLGEDVGDSHVARLTGVYRKTWAQNQHHLRHAADLVERLGNEGVPTLVLKGIPLALDYYGDLGARPMADVDLLVHPEHEVGAWRLLEGLGYTTMSVRRAAPSRWEREGDDDWYRRLRHARGYSRGPLDAIDLHSTISLDFVAADPALADVAELWADARPLTIGTVAGQTLSPSHHLFHAVVHGLGATESAVLRWIPDALTLLGVAGDEIDWDVVVTTAQRHHCALLVGEGLDHLADVWGAPVPAATRATLRSTPTDARERSLRWIRRRSGRRLVGSGYAAGLFVTSTRGLGPLRTLARAPGFLADHWQVEHRRHLPLVLAHKLRSHRRR